MPRRPLTAAETRGHVLDQGCPTPCRGHAIRTKPVTTLHVTLLGRGFNSRHLHQMTAPVWGPVLCHRGIRCRKRQLLLRCTRRQLLLRSLTLHWPNMKMFGRWIPDRSVRNPPPDWMVNIRKFFAYLGLPLGRLVCTILGRSDGKTHALGQRTPKSCAGLVEDLPVQGFSQPSDTLLLVQGESSW